MAPIPGKHPQAFASAAPSDRRTRLLLEAPILPALLTLAAPNVVVTVVTTFSSALDAFFVARLGSDALAGVSLVFPAWMLMVTMSVGGIGAAVASAVARALGAGRRGDADQLVAHALVVAVGMGLLFTGARLVSGATLFHLMGGQGAVLRAAATYSAIVFGGAVAVWLVSTLASVLRGTGEMVIPAGVIMAGELLHVVLAPTLIFGLGPAPALGVAGAAISLVTANGLRAAALAFYVLTRRSILSPDLRRLRLRARLFAEILRVGLPASLGTMLNNLSVVGLTTIAASFGTAALVGYGIASRLEYLLIPILAGLGTALVTMVGTSVGAGAIGRARGVAWRGAGLAALVAGSAGAIVAIAPRTWAGLFTTRPDVLATADAYFRIAGPTYALFGAGLALYFVCQGAGRAGWPVVNTIGRMAITLGGATVATVWLGRGISGLATAVALGFVLSGAGLALVTHVALRPRHSIATIEE
jgi:putative MATE family efflux protein